MQDTGCRIQDAGYQMPDAVLEQYWTTLSWVLGDTKLAARDKALVAFGAASAIHCSY